MRKLGIYFPNINLKFIVMIICWFSCGATSAVACYLALKKYGDRA